MTPCIKAFGGNRMSISLLTNVPSLNAQRNFNDANRSTATSQARLASGSRINSAADDPSGLGITSNMDANIRSTRQAASNSDQAANALNVSGSGLSSITDMLVRLRELGVEAASDTVGDEGRKAIGIEANGLIDEINRTANSANYGEKNLLNGQSGNLDFQIGTENNANSRLTYQGGNFDARSSALGLDSLNFSDSKSAGNGLDQLDNALGQVSNMQSHLGALQNRLGSASDQNTSNADITSAALSNRRDTDYAAESTNLFKNQARQNASAAVLAQANQQPSNALKLLEMK
jgi:flagellin